MKVENVKRNTGHKRKCLVTVRITPEVKVWMLDNNVSPTKLFYAALDDIGCKKR